MDMFNLDLRDIKKLENLCKQAPKEFVSIFRNVVDSTLFEIRKEAIKQISTNMTIRNKRFVESAIIVEKSKGSSIDSIQGFVGSIHRPRFTGWSEQEGRPNDRKRAITLAGRGGSKQAQALSIARLKPGRTIPRPSQFGGKDYKSSVRAMLRILASRGGAQPFFMPQPFKHMTPGLYILKDHKITKLQAFGHIRQAQQVHWLRNAVDIVGRKQMMSKLWTQSLDHMLKKYQSMG